MITSIYNKEATRILTKIPYMLEGFYPVFFRWESYVCSLLLDQGYLIRLKNKTYGPTKKGRDLRYSLLSNKDPMETLVILGRLRPKILDILVRLSREDRDWDWLSGGKVNEKIQ